MSMERTLTPRPAIGNRPDLAPGAGMVRRAMSFTAKGLTGARKRAHMEHRRAGRRWAPVGLGQISNGTGADAACYLSSNTATKGNALKLDTPIRDARLCIVNDGGTAEYISDLIKDGKTVYTGSKLSVAVALVGKSTGVPDTCDKDAGIPIGNLNNTFDIAVYLAAGDKCEVFVNGYVEADTLVDFIDNDDDAPGEE